MALRRGFHLSNNRVVIGDGPGDGINLYANVSIDARWANDAFCLPIGTTAERPSPEIGFIRYNITSNTFEGRTNTAWITFGSGGGGGGGMTDFPVSRNGTSTVTATGINFVNTATVTVRVTSGLNGNANIEFTSAAGGISSITVQNTNSTVNTTTKLNFLAGSNNTLSVVDDSANQRVNITYETPDLLQTQNLFKKGNSTNTANAVVSGGAVTLDCSESNVFKIKLNQNIIMNAPTNPKSGQVINIIFKQNTSGGSSVTSFNSVFKFPSGSSPILTTSSNAKDMMSCQYDVEDSCWYCVMSNNFF